MNCSAGDFMLASVVSRFRIRDQGRDEAHKIRFAILLHELFRHDSGVPVQGEFIKCLQRYLRFFGLHDARIVRVSCASVNNYFMQCLTHPYRYGFRRWHSLLCCNAHWMRVKAVVFMKAELKESKAARKKPYNTAIPLNLTFEPTIRRAIDDMVKKHSYKGPAEYFSDMVREHAGLRAEFPSPRNA